MGIGDWGLGIGDWGLGEENLINTNSIQNESNKEINYNPPTLENNLQSHLLHYKNIQKNIESIYYTYSNDVALIENCTEYNIKVAENKKLRGIILYNSSKVSFTVLDSAVVMTRTIRAINLSDSAIVISDADIRRVELWGCKKVTIFIFCQQVQAENIHILIHHDCEEIILKYGDMKVNMENYHPYNDILNEVKVPKLEDENKIILARCIKVPSYIPRKIQLFETYDKNLGIHRRKHK